MLSPRSFAPRVAKPKSDPRFVAVTEQAKSAATKLKQHPTAATKAKQASKSAKPPPTSAWPPPRPRSSTR